MKKLCTFWTNDGWDTKGCALDEELSKNGIAICSCNHLTNFAILLGDWGKCKLDRIENIYSIVMAGISCLLIVVTQFFKHFIRYYQRMVYNNRP